MKDRKLIENAYQLARTEYASLGVDTEAALRSMDAVNISLHCWQTDDVGGFETPDAELGGGGIQVTGNYPGKARTIEQLREDIEQVMRLLPGKQRLNLHAIYGDFQGKKVERDRIDVTHFQRWIDWAKKLGIGLDFNPTCFSHPRSEAGTLSSADPGVRRFWIEHCQASRLVASSFGKALGAPSIMDIWIPDGSKDLPYDRFGPRRRLIEALDEVLARPLPREHHRDAVEGKLFGLGLESYTVGSHELYLAFAATRKVMITYDTGHFHPTESVADKLSSVLPFVDVLLHVSRAVRWDSDHVVILDDDTQALAHEMVRSGAPERVAVALDYFDASINRVAAWVIGTRNVRRALLRALLEPGARLAELEARGDGTARLALLEEEKSLPWAAVWDHYCASRGAPVGVAWLEAVRAHERKVVDARREG